MNIIIDCRVFTKRATGVATYAIDAIRAICTYIPDWHLTLVSPKPFHKSIVGLPMDKIKIIIDPMFRNVSIPNIVWFHLYFPFIAKEIKADIIWAPLPETPLLSIGHARRMLTVHDVVGKEFSKTMTLTNRLVSLFLVDWSINHTDLIWCNSNYTLSKLEEYYPNRKQKKTVVGDSCSTNFKNIKPTNDEKQMIFDEYKIKKGYILFVGTLEPRKNLPFLLRLMPEIYERTGYKLVVVGASGWKNSNIATLINDNKEISEAVAFAKYVEYKKLILLYNLADLYVSTAINEGFGMPQLEAMACGCPVVSPHNSAMIEVVSGRGITIKGWDEKKWIDTISELLNSEDKRNKLKNPDISEYNWENIIKRVHDYIATK